MEEKNPLEQEDKAQGESRGTGFSFWAEHFSPSGIFKYIVLLLIIGVGFAAILLQWHKIQGFLENLAKSLAPFFAALLIAYFVSPLVEIINRFLQARTQKEHLRRPLKYTSILIAYVVVLAFISIAFTFVIPQLVDSISELAGNMPVMYNHVYDFLMNVQERYPELDTAVIAERLNEMVPDLVSFGTDVMGNLLPFVYSLSISVMRTVINILLAIMISVYMISGKKEFHYQFKRLVYAIFSEEKGNSVCRICVECNDIFHSFLIGKALDSLIIGILCCLIMNILRLPYAVLLSVIVGVTNMIPYFGPFIGAVPGVLIYLCTNPKEAVIFVLMILVLQQFDGLVLGPRILGQSTGLSPMWVIFAITIGGYFFGVLGMFIGVPVVAVIAYLINKAIKFRLKDRSIAALDKK